MAKAAFNKKKALFTGTLDWELRKKLVKCYIWSIALCGAETGTVRAVDQKQLESFEMWCWRRMEKISWTDRVRNEEILGCILYIYSTNIDTEYFKHSIYCPFFFSLQNAICFIILTHLVPVLFNFIYRVC